MACGSYDHLHGFSAFIRGPEALAFQPSRILYLFHEAARLERDKVTSRPTSPLHLVKQGSQAVRRLQWVRLPRFLERRPSCTAFGRVNKLFTQGLMDYRIQLFGIRVMNASSRGPRRRTSEARRS